MFNPIKLYVKSQEVQRNWIRNHPYQYVAINGTLIAMMFGYYALKDRRDQRKFEEELKAANQQIKI